MERAERPSRTLATALERLKRQADPAYAAQQRLATAASQLGDATAKGLISQQEQALLLGQLSQRYGLAGAAQARFAATNDNAARSGGRFGGAMQQASFQIGDFASQLASGGNAMTAFVQQGSQLLGFFGPAGALAGAGLAVAGVAASFLMARDATEDAADAQERYNRILEQAKRIAKDVENAGYERARSLEAERKFIVDNARAEVAASEAKIAARRADLMARLQGEAAGAFNIGTAELIADDPRLKAMELAARELRLQLVYLREAVGEFVDGRSRFTESLDLGTQSLGGVARGARGAASSTRDLRQANEEVTDAAANYIAGLEEENRLLQMDADERARVEAVMRAQNEAMKEGNLLLPEQIQRIRELVDENRALAAAEREREAARRNAERDAQRVHQATVRELAREERLAEQRVESVVDFAGDKFASLFEETAGGWSGMWETMERTARTTLARLAADAVVRPLITPIMPPLDIPAGDMAAALAGEAVG